MLACGAGFVIAAGMIAFAGARLAHEMQALERLAKETERAYGALNAEFPFELPPGRRPPTEARIAAYLGARRAMLATITPGAEALADRTLQAAAIEESKLLRALRRERDFFQAAACSHLAALRGSRMGLDEWLWIHGLAMRDALRDGNEPAFRSRMTRTLAAMERLSRSASAGAGDFSFDGFQGGLERRYEGWPPMPRGPLAGFESRKSVGSLIDLLAANRELFDGLELNSRLDSGPASGKSQARAE